MKSVKRSLVMRRDVVDHAKVRSLMIWPMCCRRAAKRWTSWIRRPSCGCPLRIWRCAACSIVVSVKGDFINRKRERESNFDIMHFAVPSLGAATKSSPEITAKSEFPLDDDDKMLLQALDGFLLIISHDGDVTYVSENVASILGVQQVRSELTLFLNSV